jgi:hypothetical protein
LSARENIMKEIDKKLPELTFISSADDAEIILEYGSTASKYLAGAASSSDGVGGVQTTA